MFLDKIGGSIEVANCEEMPDRLIDEVIGCKPLGRQPVAIADRVGTESASGRVDQGSPKERMEAIPGAILAQRNQKVPVGFEIR